jgi:tRNA A-37 threonylcarbamoyl transferase component Bud32
MLDQERLTQALADRYRIEGEIGSGGMATVYLAQDLKHHRQVAVKVLNPELALTLGAERFLREIRTAANLTHPHILPVHDSGEADGFLFYVMPYVEGESLRARLTKEKQLPIPDAIQITREIADALAYAHGEGVIHRDVKPANIMLEAGHAVLADFGVAHGVAEAKDERITRTGTSLGTPAYMSPEQAAGEQEPDGRSDQYALSCVLYEMPAGHPPFIGARAETVLRQHLTEEPPLVTRMRPSVDRTVVAVIHRSLAKSPADRFPTMAGFGAALVDAKPAGSTSWLDRPSWQIPAGHAVASLVVFGAAGTLTDVVGLPAWFPSAVGLICVAAFPLVLATAVFGSRGREGPASQRKGVRAWLTWRAVGLTVGVAFALLSTGTAGYMGMRVLGLGPFGTLIARGVIQDQARLLVADFSSPSRDSLTAAALESIPPIDRPNLDLAWFAASAGLPEEAEERLREWVFATPEDLQIPERGWELLARGLIAQAEGRTSEGIDYLRRAAEALHHGPASEGELAKAYDHAGMADSARVAYHRYPDAPNIDREVFDALHLPRAYERLGQLHEERGEVGEAIRNYSLFVDLWAEADPELQPRVGAARQALERLQGRILDSRGPG